MSLRVSIENFILRLASEVELQHHKKLKSNTKKMKKVYEWLHQSIRLTLYFMEAHKEVIFMFFQI